MSDYTDWFHKGIRVFFVTVWPEFLYSVPIGFFPLLHTLFLCQSELKDNTCKWNSIILRHFLLSLFKYLLSVPYVQQRNVYLGCICCFLIAFCKQMEWWRLGRWCFGNLMNFELCWIKRSLERCLNAFTFFFFFFLPKLRPNLLVYREIENNHCFMM